MSYYIKGYLTWLDYWLTDKYAENASYVIVLEKR